MASLAYSSKLFSSYVSTPTVLASNNIYPRKDCSYIGNNSTSFSKNNNKLVYGHGRSQLTVTNTASPSSPVVVSPPEEEEDTVPKHAAWTSVRQPHWEGELVVEGEIPSWLSGTYLRNGPGQWHIEDYNFRHLFDGYATVVKLRFEDGRLTAGHRQIESNAYKTAMENKKLCYREFSEVPKVDNFLSYLGSLVSLFSGASLSDNPSANIVRLADGRVICLNELTKGSIIIDPNSLETLGKFEYKDSFGGLVHAAHPIVTENELLTIMPDFNDPGYMVVRMEAGSNERKVIGRADCRGGQTSAGWVHSFPITEHYIIVPEMPLKYRSRNLFNNKPTPIYKFQWHPETKGFLHVMERASGQIVASVEVPLFVTFHFINAYEEKDEEGKAVAIIADCSEYNANTAILDHLRLQNLRYLGDQDVLPESRYGRFRISLDGSPQGTLVAALDPDEHGRGLDSCRINPAYLGKKYRYAYACGAHRPCNYPNTIIKIDLVEKKVKKWYDEGTIPSEPYFVPRPDATKEDDGIVISLISEKNGGGYALLLDGSTFEEIARARLPYGLPYGLHGCWVPKSN